MGSPKIIKTKYLLNIGLGENPRLFWCPKEKVV